MRDSESKVYTSVVLNSIIQISQQATLRGGETVPALRFLWTDLSVPTSNFLFYRRRCINFLKIKLVKSILQVVILLVQWIKKTLLQ